MRNFVRSVSAAIRLRTLGMVGGLITLISQPADAAFTNFFNFETAPVHPVALGPDGRTLAVCNLPDARVELFDVSSGVPVPSGSVSVGLDPVTARFATPNELWVVNFISSSISIVDVRTLTVTATVQTPAGPSDLVFAGQPRRAWVSCSRTNAVFVIDPVNRAAFATIAIDGERPRAMAASPDGSKVYAAIFESGNGTTILGRRLTQLNVPPAPGPVDDVSGPYQGADPPPNSGTNFNPSMVLTAAPPRVSQIVRKNAAGRWLDDNNADWTDWVSGSKAAESGRVQGWDLPDRDVAMIDTSTMQVGYATRLMNLCMAIAVNPVSGQISVVGTDATNERRFEPVLKGVFLRVNLALVDPLSASSRVRDLNPHLDYTQPSLPLAERSRALGDPRGIEWQSDGTRAYITGMGSGNLIVVNADGQRVNPQPIELGDGPTGMALDEARKRLYVWNRFSSSISVVNTEAGLVVTNVPVFDPTPEIVRKGRLHLYDTRRNSGLGIVSCASCHPDGRMDRLAWDLGNPAGSTVTNNFWSFHPMKGPMVTQTLQDIITPTNYNGRPITQTALHWRGDRRNIEAFNPTFTALLARDTQLTTNEMAELKGMLSSISFPPNFLRTFSNSLPTQVPLPGHFGRMPTNGGTRLPLPPGNPTVGLASYGANCRRCHEFNSGRGGLSNSAAFPLTRSGTEGVFGSAQLRSLADKTGMDGLSTNSRSGFGLMHDGRVDTLTQFLVDGFPETAINDQAIANMVALMLCFSGSDVGFSTSPSQDVPASAGYQVTLASSTPTPMLDAMVSLAGRSNSRLELVVSGKQEGRMRHWLFQPASQIFQPDHHGEPPATLGDLLALAQPGNELTAMLVPRGTGVRLALDRDGDGYFDDSEGQLGFDPANPSSHPGRVVDITKVADEVTLSWESVATLRYVLEWAPEFPSGPSPNVGWTPIGQSITATGPLSSFTDTLPAGERQRFYRVRMQP